MHFGTLVGYGSLDGKWLARKHVAWGLQVQSKQRLGGYLKLGSLHYRMPYRLGIEQPLDIVFEIYVGYKGAIRYAVSYGRVEIVSKRRVLCELVNVKTALLYL